MKTLLSAALAGLTFLLGTSAAHGAPCAEAISKESAEAVFAALKQAKPADGCTLGAIDTEQSRMSIVWNKEGVAQPAIVVVPSACAESPPKGMRMAATIPPVVEASCPSAVAATRSALAAGVLGNPVRAGGDVVPTAPEPTPFLARRSVRLGAALVVLLVLGALLMFWRRDDRTAA